MLHTASFSRQMTKDTFKRLNSTTQKLFKRIINIQFWFLTLVFLNYLKIKYLKRSNTLHHVFKWMIA